jgi:hypothetical protein
MTKDYNKIQEFYSFHAATNYNLWKLYNFHSSDMHCWIWTGFQNYLKREQMPELKWRKQVKALTIDFYKPQNFYQLPEVSAQS